MGPRPARSLRTVFAPQRRSPSPRQRPSQARKRKRKSLFAGTAQASATNYLEASKPQGVPKRQSAPGTGQKGPASRAHAVPPYSVPGPSLSPGRSSASGTGRRQAKPTPGARIAVQRGGPCKFANQHEIVRRVSIARERTGWQASRRDDSPIARGEAKR
jgi:hypothetical protein